MNAYNDSSVIFGLMGPDVKILPCPNLPAGKVRYRFRSDRLAQAFVKTDDGILAFHLMVDSENESQWKAYPFAANIRRDSGR